ncbi:MAG TPA: nitroreductase family protein [Haloplasmataceae bacterium]
MNNNLLLSIKKRRSIYNLNNTSPLTDEEIMTIIEQSIMHTPSAFNSQSSRIIVLLKLEHEKLWDITTETLRRIVPEEAFGSTLQKMRNFKAAYGTVLFFEDQNVIEKLQKDYALYKDNFPIWSEQTSGMLQLVIWTALSENGLGASLQHYNPLIDAEVKKTWNIPDSWKLIAQMPFGTPTSEAGPKEFLPTQDRVKLYK